MTGAAAGGIRLDGKVALVTGGSRGIGLAIAKACAKAGAKVMISSRRTAALESAVREIVGEAAHFTANAGDPEAAEACVEATVDRFGGLDILVNNAATNPYFGPMIDIDESRAAKTVSVNQIGALTWSRCAWRSAMRDAGGTIVNIASIGGCTVEPNIGFYNVTKAALIHLTRQLAGEIGPAVRVNGIAPGLVKTDMARALWETREDEVAGRLPLRRLGEVEDIANAALFLASDLASWITGHTLVVDGGAMVRNAAPATT
jgi:NAD(P)-dependent dehydrogenase (short-subunit alcohol dehydrogenase family)